MLTVVDLAIQFKMHNHISADQSVTIFCDSKLLKPKTKIIDIRRDNKNAKFQVELLSSFG